MSDTGLPLRPLGSTGLRVSALGLGTVKLGRNQGVRYPEGFELPPDAAVRDLLACARERGISLLDTAPAYGSSEERLGRLLTRRQEWIICSKVGEEFSEGRSSFDYSPAHTRKSVERSLRRLNTDYLDIVLLHSDGNDRSNIFDSGCIETLKEMRNQGYVRAVGVSTKTLEGGLAAVDTTDLVMVTLNRDESADGEVVEYARRNSRGVLVKKALASGHACLAQDKDPVQASLRFVFSFAGVNSVIVGTINKAHLAHNVDAAIAALGVAGQ